jgi:hypothetical protein
MTHEVWCMMRRLWMVKRTLRRFMEFRAPESVVAYSHRRIETVTRQARKMGITDEMMLKYEPHIRKDIETYEAESDHRFECFWFAEYSNAHEDDPDYQKNYGKPFCKHNCKCDLKCKNFRQLTDKEKTDLQWYP